MTLRKDVEKAVKKQEFESTAKLFLSREDRDYLSYSVKEYQTYKSVSKLMQSLISCLDTPEKLDLLPLIRDLMIPKHDHRKFDSLAPYGRMAHPSLSNPVHASGSDCRIVKLTKRKDQPLGLSIRGGKEYNLGIYISEVESESIAERSGLVVGDQILSVNGISFENIMHPSAALVLRSHEDLVLNVKTAGTLPGGRLVRSSLIWVDTAGRHVREPGTSRQDDCKIILHPDKKKSLGLSIRGGSEYQLGIFVSGIDTGSPADICGLKVGDQIIEVNGHNFKNILHKEAVTILKSYSPLMMTIKSLGIIPILPEEIKEPADMGHAQVAEEEVDGQNKEADGWEGVNRKETTERKNVVSMSYDIVHGSPALSKSSHRDSQHASVKRSKSLRTPSDRLPMHSTPTLQTGRPRASSTGQKEVRRSRSTMAVLSPLAVHAIKAEGVPGDRDKQLHQPTESANDEELAEPSFFEPGLAGTQVMLAFATSQAEQLLMDESRRLLTEPEMLALKAHLQEYNKSNNIKDFAEFLIALLDNREKARLFNDIRSVLHPRDIARYDKLVVPHELVAIKKPGHVEGSSDAADGYNGVLTDLQTNGPPKLRQVKEVGPKPSVPDLGPFKDPNAMNILQKATRKEPLLSGVQTAESFMAWHEEDREKPQLAKSIPTPITFELQKGSAELGIEIEGGVNRGTAEIRIKELKPEGAAKMNDLLKPGFEIFEVDGIMLRGKKKREAYQILNHAYHSDRSTLKMTIIPV